ncbi:hypothetical protein HNQ56_000356 [Anaerotaenia torta]
MKTGQKLCSLGEEVPVPVFLTASNIMADG